MHNEKYQEDLESVELQLLGILTLLNVTIKNRTGDSSTVLQATLRHLDVLTKKHDILAKRGRTK